MLVLEEKIMVDETWKDIKYFENIYQISNLGNIRRFWPNADNGYKILSPWIDQKTGYKRVDLCVNRKKDFRRVHQLVLETFVGPRAVGMECRHLNGDKQNNQLTNLKWGTRSANQKDRRIHGNPSMGGNFKLKPEQVSDIKRLLRSGRNSNAGRKYPHRVIADMFGVKRGTIGDINTGRHWRYVE